jgi:hypothetical protein
VTHNEPDPKAGAQPGETSLGRLRDWLGLERNILVMLAAVLVVGMGEELWTRFIPKYLKLLGASTWVVAIYGTQKYLLDAIYQYPGGWLADRLGRRAALVLFTVLASVGYGLYLVGPGLEWILVGTFFVMAWHSLALPALFAIVGDSLPQTRRAIGFPLRPCRASPLPGGAPALRARGSRGLGLPVFRRSQARRQAVNPERAMLCPGGVWPTEGVHRGCNCLRRHPICPLRGEGEAQSELRVDECSPAPGFFVRGHWRRAVQRRSRWKSIAAS